MRATSLYKSDICPHPTHCLPELLKRLTMVPRKGSWHPCKVVSEKNGSVRILIRDLECWFWSAIHAFLYAFVIFVIPWKGELSNGFCASFQLCQIWSGGDPSGFSFIHGNEHLSTVRDELATKISRLKVSCVQESDSFHDVLSKNFNLVFPWAENSNEQCLPSTINHPLKWCLNSHPIQI